MFAHSMRLSRVAAASVGIVGLACLAALPARAQVQVYSNNFDGGSIAGFTSSNLNIATRTNNGITYLATPDTGSNRYGFGAGTATLTLNNAALVGTVTASFDLYIIGSMDGNGQNGGASDPWSLTADGNTLKHHFRQLHQRQHAGVRQPYESQRQRGGSAHWLRRLSC